MIKESSGNSTFNARGSNRRKKKLCRVLIALIWCLWIFLNVLYYITNSVGNFLIDQRGRCSNYPVRYYFQSDVLETLTPYIDHWQIVSNTRDKFFVFSAYFDDRKGRNVRVIAAARTDEADNVTCLFHFEDSITFTAVVGINVLINEHHDLNFSAYYILCPLSRSQRFLPTEVSIIKYGSNTFSNRLQIHYQKHNMRKNSNNFAVCVKPLHSVYNNPEQLVEFIEYYRLMGADHYIFYNRSIGKEVDCVLKAYISEELVTILPWKLNLVSRVDIRTEGIFAALNDCLYRTMYMYQFVAMVDVDEYIIPYRHANLKQMLMEGRRKKTGAFSFQNAFFFRHVPSDFSTKSLPYQLLTLQKTVRSSNIYPHGVRSKFIVLPENVIEVGNHFVWQFVEGKQMVDVSYNISYVHHYRFCDLEIERDACVNVSYIIDRRCHYWMNDLLYAVENRFKLLETYCVSLYQLLNEHITVYNSSYYNSSYSRDNK